jgi:hypothetical protein
MTMPGQGTAVAPADLPVLDLSGPPLRAALEKLVAGSEAQGGVERYVEALNLKTRLFRSALAGEAVSALDTQTFGRICAFVAPARRRVSPYLGTSGFTDMREAIAELTQNLEDTSLADRRMARFCAHFPADRQHRWVRDLGAELLHYLDPERYPLMCRWVWDAGANTGALREIWYADKVDEMTIEVADDYATFLALRRELSQFLNDNGVFRDTLFYVDLLLAQVYADYICARGGTYLRADFSAPEDPLQFVRRLLGLDGVNAVTGRLRLKTADGGSTRLSEAQLTSLVEGKA